MSTLITADLETFYDRAYSLSRLTTEEYIRDARFQVIGVGVKEDVGESVWYDARHHDIADVLRSYHIEDKHLLAHNCCFDSAILGWHYGIYPKYYVDTLSMARPLGATVPGNSLAKLVQHFQLGEKGDEVVKAMGKRLEDFTDEELKQYGEYCRNDVDLTYRLFKVLKQFSTSKEMRLIDMFVRMYTDPVLVLDRPTLVAKLDKVRKEKERLMQALADPMNKDALMSNAKFAELLEAAGVTPPMKISERTGKPTLALSKKDPEFLALLEHDDTTVQALAAARLGIKSTQDETRTERFLDIQARGTLPVMLNYYAAHTGRVGGADGVNLQNLPRGGELRSAIKSPEHHKLLAGDSAQIEARVLAWWAGQYDLVRDFRDGVDIYCKFASTVYEREVTKADEAERFLGKTGVLGLGYGTGATKLKLTLDTGNSPVHIDEAEAKRVVDLYRSTYPLIPELWKSAKDAIDAMLRGYDYELGVKLKLLCNAEGVHLPNGMLLRYPNLRREGDEILYDSKKGPVRIYGPKLVENVTQSLARIVVFDQTLTMDIAMKRFGESKLCNTLSATGTPMKAIRKIVLSVHDEMVACVPATEVSFWELEMQKIMRQGPAWADGLPLACETHSADNYGACK